VGKKYVLLLLITHVICSNTSTADNSFEASFNNGCRSFKDKKFVQATREFEKTVHINPQCYQAYYNLGLIYKHNKNVEKAIQCFLQALKINPQYDLPHEHLAHIYFNQGKHTLAKPHYQKVVHTNINNCQAHHHLGKIYLEETLMNQCEYHLTEAVSLEPNNIRILLDCANAKNIMNKTNEALDLYVSIDRLHPNNPSIVYNIAYTLKKLGRLKEALPYYKKVLAMNPEHSAAHFSYGLALLLTGEWERGWQEYEWRLIKNGQLASPHYNKPMWDGSDLHGKTIYIRAEQGLGDTFQFIRYAKIAKEMGGTTIVAVQPQLVHYLKLCPYIDTVISWQYAPSHFDVYAPMLSFPMILNTSPDTVPTPIPYLPADETLTAHWRDKLSHDKKCKIGICWQGNPNYNTHFLRMAVAAKSIPLNTFLPLFDIPNSSFYCLQRKTGTDQLTTLPPGTQLTIFDEYFDVKHGSFMDSAAVMKNLDLVITVDTSIAHFAAGLGTPTWVLIPDPPDWRWMLDRSDTPWYPNMRLFRQSQSGDWQSVMQTVSEELKKYVDTWQQSNLVKSEK